MSRGANYEKRWCPTCDRETVFNARTWTCLSCKVRLPRESKYGNKPTDSKFTGRRFQSKLEAEREPILIALHNVGKIRDLRYQTPFPLKVYGTQAVEALVVELRRLLTEEPDRRVGPALEERLIRDVERSLQEVGTYRADFTYLDDRGHFVVEDTKGFRTQVYLLKRRLMIACHNIEVQEPDRGGVQMKARGASVSGRGTGSRFRGGR